MEFWYFEEWPRRRDFEIDKCGVDETVVSVACPHSYITTYMPTDSAFDDSDEEVIVLYNLAAVAFRHDVAEACPPRLEPLGPEKLLFWRSRLSVFHKMMGMSIETFNALKDFYV